MLEVVRSRACRLAVFDGFNPLLLLHGLDPNKGTEVEAFTACSTRSGRGVAVVITDNVVKAGEGRGAWAIGRERKKSKAEVHLGMKGLEPLAGAGWAGAGSPSKDRPGFLTRPRRGGPVRSTQTTTAPTWSIEEDTSRDDEGVFRPTELMELLKCLSLEIRSSEPPCRESRSKEAVKGKGTYIRVAIDRLVAEVYACQHVGARMARLVRFERSFRKDDGSEDGAAT